MTLIASLALSSNSPVELATLTSELATLEAKLAKVDRAMEETEALMARTPTAAYLPELRYRLCDLYVQKSRLTLHREAAKRGSDDTTRFASPEVRLLKEKAVALYARLLKDSPDYAGADQARFFMAHELRELGQLDEMVKVLGELGKRHPRSPLAKDAELILGDHFVGQSNLREAEKHYQVAQRGPPSHAAAMARYKLGWLRVNQGDHEGAFDFFASVLAMKTPTGADAQKVQDVRREALVDLAFSYVEVKPPKGALAYFAKQSDSTPSYALVLEKLASRYLARQEPENAVPVLRRLLGLRPDPEHDVERVGQLYDALRTASHQSLPQAADVGFLVRAAVEVRLNFSLEPNDRAKQLTSLEEMARDLSTRLHQVAQKRGDRALLAEAARAYGEYLGLFRPQGHVAEMMQNRADALFAARDYPEAARQFEALAQHHDGVDRDGEEAALWGALVAHRASLAQAELERRSRFETVEARTAMKQLGVAFLRRFPRNPHLAEVEFNIARAHFDDGEYRPAGRRFAAFALAHPEHQDASAAGHLALESFDRLHDAPRLLEVGRRLLASALPASFKSEVKRVMAEVENEAMADLALAAAQRTGDVVAGLEQAAFEAKDEATAAKALSAAMLAAREKGDFDKEKALGLKLLEAFPNQPQAKGVHLALATRAAETARFAEAAEWYERAGELSTAGHLQFALGDSARGAKLLEAVAQKAKGPEAAELYASIAEELLKADRPEPALEAARRAYAKDSDNARAAALVLWFAAEPEFADFRARGAEALEAKVAAWRALVPQYTRIASLGSPEWAVASLWRVGLGFQELATAALATVGAEGDEARAAVEQQVAPLQERAREAFETCVQRADELGIFTDAVVGCRGQREGVGASWAKTRSVEPREVPKTLQARVDRAQDAPSLTALANAFLERGNPQAARLAFLRALELDRAYAPALAGLGWALLQLGEASAAARAYTSALEVDPANTLARGNLAALRCRFGDADGARAELEKVPRPALSAGPSVDPQWQGCLDTVSRR
jgi:tetratricopeptide (TPR) repeat protein